MSELLPRKERGIDRGRNKDGTVPGIVWYGTVRRRGFTTFYFTDFWMRKMDTYYY